MATTAETRSRLAAAERSRRRSWLGLRWVVGGYLTMILIAAVMAVPLLWMVTTAFKSVPEIYRTPITLVPERLRWENFRDAWQAVPFGRFLLNTLIVAGVATLVKVINAVVSAYALVFMQVRARKLLFMFVVAALMVPNEVTIVPNYLLIADLGWVNTYQGILLPMLGVAYGVFLLRQHFMSLPKEIMEAVRVDGAGHLRTLLWVVLPVSRPVVVTVTLIYLVADWNAYLWPLIVTNSLEMRTLPIGLAYLLDTEGNTRWGIVMAGSLIVVAPVLASFLWMQRHLVHGLTSGSVKG
jgi:sn-glycerol 3-phosphate transport system permease protein